MIAKSKDTVDADILIIGGGIYGCGVAQAISAGGFKTILVEKNSLASGTSSQSTKLIHGGLRYLEQFNLKLVYEALSERECLLKIAPDLVSRQWFYIPVYSTGKRPAWFITCGLFLYYLLSAGRSKFKWIKKNDWSTKVAGLNTKDLKAVLAYEDAATDDAALTRAVAASAKTLGCKIFEQTTVESAKFNGSYWQVKLANGEQLTARVLVNAAGPWVNIVSKVIYPEPPTLNINLVQGTHLLLNRDCTSFIYTESLDGRVMFFRPWRGKTLVGTTEVLFQGDPEQVKPRHSEIDAILNTYNFYFPDSVCLEADILETYCGLRVLPEVEQAAFFASRETVIAFDQTTCPAYFAIYGGKLTTYRKESEKVLKLIKNILPATATKSTKEIHLDSVD